MKKTIIFLLVLISLAASLQADIVKGRVVDAQTGEPLDGAQVKAMMTSGEGTSVWVLMADTLGRFILESYSMRRITLHAEYFGYKPATAQYLSGAGMDTVVIDDIRLEPSEVLMKELAVEGRARRFYMRGDTVVFNPQGFSIEDNQRLQDLVLQLPGVSVKDGRLMWNGKPVSLMMNGHEALSEEMLMRQLPVEAVENIKAYERKSELEEHTGVDDGQREQVLDVTVKPGFMDRWSGEVNATAYSRPNYAATLDGMRLSDTDPVMFFLRVADDPRAINKHTYESIWEYGGGDAIRQQLGGAGYKHAWKPFAKSSRDSYWTLTAGANHRDTPHRRWENTQTFLPNTLPTETDKQTKNNQHSLSAPLDFSTRIELSPKLTMQIESTLAYDEEKQMTDRQEQTSITPLSEGQGGGVNTAHYQSSSHAQGLSGLVRGKMVYNTKKGMLGGQLSANYKHRKEQGSSQGDYHYLQEGTSAIDRQRFETPTDNLSVVLNLGYMQALGKKVMLMTQWGTTYDYGFRDEQRWRADTLDTSNSLHRRDNLWKNELELGTQVTLGKLALGPKLTFSHRHEQTAYQRGKLDTLARRNLLLAMPELELNYRMGKQQGLKANVSYAANPSELIDCIGYRDDTNPLYIIEGNPNLKTSHTLTANLNYNLMRTRGTQSLGITLDYSKAYDPVGTVLHYNSQTGAYRSQKQNVRGGSQWGASVNYDRSLGKNLQLQQSLSGQLGTTYGILTLVDEATGLTYNRQGRSRLRERLSLNYDVAPWQLWTSHTFTWDGYTYSDATQSAENIFYYLAELRILYKLKSGWRFTLSPQFILNRGYQSSSMNNNPFLLNAEVAYKFVGGKCALLRHLNNRAEITLAGRDLLNQNRRNFSTISATSHTEGGESFLHSYVTLSLRYRWDPKKK